MEMCNFISLKRNSSYDLIRIVAFLMVVFIHAPIGDGTGHNFFLGSISFICSPCIGLFLMISGALLLPVKTDALMFIKRRLGKIVVPTLLWSIVYIFICNFKHSGVKAFIGILLDWEGHPVLWYMYVLIGLYLLAPIISGWLDKCSRKELKFYLYIWAITLFYPIINLYIETNNTPEGILYYFTGYVGYYTLGFYIRKYGGGMNTNKWICISLFLFVLPILYKVLHWEFPQSDLFGYLSPVTAIITLTWFLVLDRLMTLALKKKKFSERLLKNLTTIANLTFGGYLIHIFVLLKIVNKYILTGVESYIPHSLLAWLLTVIISIAMCYLISLLPYSKYIIGYQLYGQNKSR